MLHQQIFRLLVICMAVTLNYVGMSFAATFEIPPATGIPSHIIQAEVSENQPIGTEVIRIGVNNPEGSTLHFRFFYGYYFFDHEYNG
ncbi:hypothetical protein JT359_18585, partial [Candidatus Poribacteria bacterium]|nr:hypothetical protein [Candidatus Poribacteria bacterium]